MDSGLETLEELTKQKHELQAKLDQINTKINALCQHTSVTKYLCYIDHYPDPTTMFECNTCQASLETCLPSQVTNTKEI